MPRHTGCSEERLKQCMVLDGPAKHKNYTRDVMHGVAREQHITCTRVHCMIDGTVLLAMRAARVALRESSSIDDPWPVSLNRGLLCIMPAEG